MNKKYVENLTLAYLYSRELAFEETRNTGLAAECAGTVIMIIATVERQNQPKPDFLQTVLAMAAQAKKKQDHENGQHCDDDERTKK